MSPSTCSIRPQSAGVGPLNHSICSHVISRPRTAAPATSISSQRSKNKHHLSASGSQQDCSLPQRRKKATPIKCKSLSSTGHIHLPRMTISQSADVFVLTSERCPHPFSQTLTTRNQHNPRIRSVKLPLKEKIKRLESSIIHEHAHSSPASRSPSPTHRISFPTHLPDNANQSDQECFKPMNNLWVMPCHKPEDVIIAEADYRIRKQLYAKDYHVKALSEIRSKVDTRLQQRQERIASVTARIELQQRQSTALTVVHATTFLYFIATKLKVQRRLDAANKIPGCSLSDTKMDIKSEHDLYRREEFKEKYIRFLETAEKYKWRLQMAVSIVRKRMAVRIVKTWMRELRSCPKVKKSAHNYIVKVNIIQRAVRSFILTRKARIRMLAIVWDREEFKYVKKKLVKIRKEKDDKNLERALDMCDTVPLPVRRGIRDRITRWKYTNSKMKALLKKHDEKSSVKIDSPLDVESDEEDIVSDPYVRLHLAPYAIKENSLFQLVKEKRREFLSYVEKRRLACTVLQTTYTVEDAKMYIAGFTIQGGPVSGGHIITALLKFNIFRMIGDAEIRDRIVSTHKTLQTFEKKRTSIFDRKTIISTGNSSMAM